MKGTFLCQFWVQSLISFINYCKLFFPYRIHSHLQEFPLFKLRAWTDCHHYYRESLLNGIAILKLEFY